MNGATGAGTDFGMGITPSMQIAIASGDAERCRNERDTFDSSNAV